MLELYLIRHGKTYGNELKRYIGRTDESLSETGIDELAGRIYPEVDMVFCSPMLRCRETASILFPGQELYLIEDLRECDFGDFENKNYLELSGNPDYQKWIDSNGVLPFPHGESRENFIRRSLEGFEIVVSACLENNVSRAGLVVHGGTIMAIMEKYGRPKKGYYDWQMKNGCGISVAADLQEWQTKKELHVIEKLH